MYLQPATLTGHEIHTNWFFKSKTATPSSKPSLSHTPRLVDCAIYFLSSIYKLKPGMFNAAQPAIKWTSYIFTWSEGKLRLVFETKKLQSNLPQHLKGKECAEKGGVQLELYEEHSVVSFSRLSCWFKRLCSKYSDCTQRQQLQIVLLSLLAIIKCSMSSTLSLHVCRNIRFVTEKIKPKQRNIILILIQQLLEERKFIVMANFQQDSKSC